MGYGDSSAAVLPLVQPPHWKICGYNIKETEGTNLHCGSTYIDLYGCFATIIVRDAVPDWTNLQAIWLFFQAIGAAIFWQEVAESVTSIRKSHDSLSYFDLLEIAGYICFDYPFKYVWLFQTQRIQEFFDQLQDSPVLKISSKVSTPVGHTFTMKI